MKVLSVDIDSSERDPNVYPNPDDYTVRLNKRLYGVTKLTLTEARIPNCVTLIGPYNSNIIVDDVTYTVPHGTYTNGADLASNLQSALVGSSISSVTFGGTATSNLVFSNAGSTVFKMQFPWGDSPASVLGLNGSNVTGSTVTTGSIDLTGPGSIFLRLTVGADDLDKELFVNGGTFTFGDSGGLVQRFAQVPPHYIGRIILGTLGEIHILNVVDAPITYQVPNLNIDDIRVRMYWNNGTKLVPYDFGSRNHILKFDVTCETDRFNKVYDTVEVDELPPPVESGDPFLEPRRLSNNYIFIGIAIILIFGLWVLLFNEPSLHIQAAGV